MEYIESKRIKNLNIKVFLIILLIPFSFYEKVLKIKRPILFILS